MIKAFKDPYKINLVLTALFLTGMAVSAFMLFRLPSKLLIPYGFESAFNAVYSVIGITFLVGCIAIIQSIRHRKELVVYRDRKDNTQQEDGSQGLAKGTITTDSVRKAIGTARNPKEILEQGLEAICKQVEAGQGAGYLVKQENDSRIAELQAGYALSVNEKKAIHFEFGEGLVGQAAASGQTVLLDELPEGYIKVISGLGTASPRYLLIVPLKNQNTVMGALEIATFAAFSPEQRNFIEQSAQLIAEKLSNK